MGTCLKGNLLNYLKGKIGFYFLLPMICTFKENYCDTWGDKPISCRNDGCMKILSIFTDKGHLNSVGLSFCKNAPRAEGGLYKTNPCHINLPMVNYWNIAE